MSVYEHPHSHPHELTNLCLEMAYEDTFNLLLSCAIISTTSLTRRSIIIYLSVWLTVLFNIARDWLKLWGEFTSLKGRVNTILLKNIALFLMKRMMTSNGVRFCFNIINLNFTTCIEVLISSSIMVSLDVELRSYMYVHELHFYHLNYDCCIQWYQN